MSIDTITAKIVSDATEYANGLISEAKKEAESITAKARKEADVIKERMTARVTNDIVTVKHRKLAAAKLEVRKMQLAVKQKAVMDSMEAAMDRLAKLDQKEYISFFARKVAETGIKEGQLILNEKDRAAVGEKIVQAANELLKGGKLSLSDKTMNAKGGFILRYGALEINSSLETMIHSVKEDVTPEVVAVLFDNYKHEGN